MMRNLGGGCTQSLRLDYGDRPCTDAHLHLMAQRAMDLRLRRFTVLHCSKMVKRFTHRSN